MRSLRARWRGPSPEKEKEKEKEQEHAKEEQEEEEEEEDEEQGGGCGDGDGRKRNALFLPTFDDENEDEDEDDDDDQDEDDLMDHGGSMMWQISPVAASSSSVVLAPSNVVDSSSNAGEKQSRPDLGLPEAFDLDAVDETDSNAKNGLNSENEIGKKDEDDDGTSSDYETKNSNNSNNSNSNNNNENDHDNGIENQIRESSFDSAWAKVERVTSLAKRFTSSGSTPTKNEEEKPKILKTSRSESTDTNRSPTFADDEGGGESDSDTHSCPTLGDNSPQHRAVPTVVKLPEEMWEEMVNVATKCWRTSCESGKSKSVESFAELGVLMGCTPLGPRNDPDVVFSQLLKDIKRETVQVNEKVFEGSSSFDSLYNALEEIILQNNPKLSGTPLEHKVQRILRGCSRTVSGYDSYDTVSALMSKTTNPSAIVTPGMMNNSPITIRSKGNMITVGSVNVFKLSREVHDGSLATVVVFKTEVTEQIELDSWSTVRWMSLKPLDKAEECVNPLLLFRDRTLENLLEKTKILDQNSDKDTIEHNKALFDLIAQTKESLNLAIEQTIKSIKNLSETEYHRGYEDGSSNAARVAIGSPSAGLTME